MIFLQELPKEYVALLPDFNNEVCGERREKLSHTKKIITPNS